MNKVLEGVKVVELSTYAAAPGAGRILADFGADVIKIESPWGDPFRAFGLSVNAPVDDDENPCFQLENANKRGITLNLKSEEGKEILYKLLADANIFLTNTRINSLKKMGLDYDSLKERFPHLVYGHVSGYGFKGEDADMPGYDITAFWARGGGLADLAFDGYGPLVAPCGVGDHSSSLALVAGLLGALHKQTVTGEGDYVLISLFGVAVFLNSLMTVPSQDKEGYNEHYPKDKYMPLTPISNTYVCKDKEMITLTVLDYARDWGKFCKAIKREDLIDEKRFNNPADAKLPENSKELVKLLEETFAKEDRPYWIERLKEYDLPFSATRHFREVTKDPMAWENGYLTDFKFPNGHNAAIPNTPIQFKENVGAPCTNAPLLGEHNEEILKEYGYSDEEIASLREKKAI